MTTFTVNGIFTGRLNDGTSGAPLTGTIDITGGAITAMDLIVPAFPLHFTQIYFNQPYDGVWLLSGQTAGSCDQIGCQEDYLVFEFNPLPGPQLANFQQAKFTYGAVVHNTYGLDYADYLAHGGTTTYYGYSLQGTICPLEGCSPFPLPPPSGAPLGVPGPVAGADLPTLLLAALIIFGGFYWKRRAREKTND